MRIIWLFWMVCLFVASVSAQPALTGKIIDGKGEAVQLVNISLFSVLDSNYICGTTTDRHGKFRIQNPSAQVVVLRISCVGYKTQNIRAVSGDLGKITLCSYTTKLDEVSVIGDAVFFQEDKLICFPTREQIERSPTGMILIDRLGLPGINLDLVSNSISAIGGGKVIILINDRPSGLRELQGIPAKNIIKVEYSDTPSARFPDAAIILNFMVKRLENGGSVSFDLTNGLSAVYGEDIMYLKLYKKKSQYSFYYNPQFRKFNSQYRTYDEKFFLLYDTLNRAEIGLKDDFSYLFNNLYLGYNNQKDKRIIDFSLSGKINHTPDNNYRSFMLNSHYRDTLNMTDHAESKNYLPRMSFYYQQGWGKDQWLYFNTTAGYNNGSYQRKYAEYIFDKTVSAFNTHSGEEQHYYSGSVLYKNSFTYPKKVWRSIFSAGLTHYYSHTRNNSFVNGGTENVTTMDYHQTTFNGMLYFIKKNFLIAGMLGLNRSSYDIENKKTVYYGFSPVVGMIYQMTKKWKLTWEGEVKNLYPSLSQLNTFDLFVDNYQIQRGKEDLRQALAYKNSLSFAYLNQKFQFFSRWKYHFTDRPVMEYSCLEGEKIIRGIDNQKAFHFLNAELESGGKNLFGHLTVIGYGGVKRYISKGHSYSHILNDFYYGGRINLSYGKWELNTSLLYRVNDSFFGETMIRREDGNKITLSYINNNLLASFGVLNPFAHGYGEGRTNYSVSAPYSNYRYINQINNLFFVKLVKVFNWGKTLKVPEKELPESELESSIRKIDK